MKRTRRKRKLQNKRTYSTFKAMVIHDAQGDVLVERCLETGELSFMCPSSIDGDRLKEIKEKHSERINLFRQRGGSREAK